MQTSNKQNVSRIMDFAKRHKKLSIFIAILAVSTILGAMSSIFPSSSSNSRTTANDWKRKHYMPICEKAISSGEGLSANTTEYVVCTRDLGYNIKSKDEEPVKTTKSDDAFTDALRKCTVMEASDIYITGIGGSRSTAFSDALKTCNSFVVDTYKNNRELFISDATTDWNDRKNEQINGRNLEYYLSTLGW